MNDEDVYMAPGVDAWLCEGCGQFRTLEDAPPQRVVVLEPSSEASMSMDGVIFHRYRRRRLIVCEYCFERLPDRDE